MTDLYSLKRFIDAQEKDYDTALAEIRRGRKTSHWIWYIFPQLRGLGRSEYSFTYGLGGIEEAKKYIEHPILGQRLIEITQAVLQHSDKTAAKIFGCDIDAKKFRSCMTLFREAAPEITLFDDVLNTFFGGEPDYRTLERVRRG